MTDFDYATQKRSSLDIAKPFNSGLGIDEKQLQDLMASYDDPTDYHK
jgi:hypothetical protein